MRRRGCLAPALALLVACADPHRVAGVGSGTDVAEKGSLKALLLITDDLEEVERRWAQPTPPVLEPINAAQIGDRVYALIVFTGCAVDDTGLCRLVADYAITDPSGHRTESERGRPVSQERPPPQPGALALGEESTGFTLYGGPAGEYRVHATVRDEIADVVLELDTSFRVE